MSFSELKRREFLSLLGGAAASWPLAARAALLSPPVIGFLRNTTAEGVAPLVEGFRRGLASMGFVDGQNVQLAYRWTNGQSDRVPALIAELLDLPAAVLVASGNEVAVAAKKATATVPVVFATGADPVALGLVGNLRQPGRNVTGVTFLSATLVAKQIEILNALMPGLATIALLTDPENFNSAVELRDAKTATAALSKDLLILNATDEAAFEPSIAAVAERRAIGLVIGGAALFLGKVGELAELSARYGVPAIYPARDFAAAGGLLSYGGDATDSYRLLGLYAGRILKGDKPADLPVQQSTKVSLTINMKAAKALGLSFPLSLLGRADEVIE